MRSDETAGSSEKPVQLKKVLIVEDHPDIMAMMKLMVNMFGYNVIEASDGYDAIEATKDQHPDLILMDIAMPLLDGLSAARIIKSYNQSSRVPVIAVTSFRDRRREAFDAGCIDVLDKPVEFPRLKEVLDLHLASQ